MGPIEKVIYKSAKGDNFLPIHAWVDANLTPEEREEFDKLTSESPDYQKVYKRWVEEEQIIRHIFMIDDEIIYDNPVIV